MTPRGKANDRPHRTLSQLEVGCFYGAISGFATHKFQICGNFRFRAASCVVLRQPRPRADLDIRPFCSVGVASILSLRAARVADEKTRIGCGGVVASCPNQDRARSRRQIAGLQKSAVKIFGLIAVENSSGSSPSTLTQHRPLTSSASSRRIATASARSMTGSPAAQMRRSGSSSGSWMTFSTIDRRAA
jgi:hypothetical protein